MTGGRWSGVVWKVIPRVISRLLRVQIVDIYDAKTQILFSEAVVAEKLANDKTETAEWV